MFENGDAILAGAPAVVAELEPMATVAREVAPILR